MFTARYELSFKYNLGYSWSVKDVTSVYLNIAHSCLVVAKCCFLRHIILNFRNIYQYLNG